MVNVKGELKIIKKVQTKKEKDALELKILQNSDGNLQVVSVMDYQCRGWKLGAVDIPAYVFAYVSKKGVAGINLVAV